VIDGVRSTGPRLVRRAVGLPSTTKRTSPRISSRSTTGLFLEKLGPSAKRPEAPQTIRERFRPR
jgi:hypothetical protein